MLAVVLGLTTAVAYGASDFLAGLMSRRMHYAVIGTVAQLTAMVSVLLVLPLAGGTPSPAGLAWGALSGVGAGVGSFALYRGLGKGRMNVVAPISAAGSAILPVGVGLLLGERPSLVTLVGVVLLVPAIALISMTGGSGGRLAEGTWDGLLAGAGFGLLFVALAQAGDDTGLWPTAAGGVVSFLVLLVFLLIARRRGPLRGAETDRPDTSVWLGAVAAGVLGAVATTTYLLATRVGLLVVVAVLAALYPAVTVMLARVVLKETASRVQLLGLLLAAAGVVAIAVG